MKHKAVFQTPPARRPRLPFLALLLAFSLALCPLAGCAAQKVSAVGFYLDTVVTLTAYGAKQAALDALLARCADYEAILSRTREGSDVWRINHANGAPVTVSDDTAAVLAVAIEYGEKSGGRFDVTIAPASGLWDFTAEQPAPPDPTALAEAAARVDYTQIKLEGNTVTLPASMQLDLGGIAKGYIADKIAEECRAAGVKRAILNFGGNVVTIGKKPDGAPFSIGIQDPAAQNGESRAALAVTDESLVTSGTYQRFFLLDGTRYHHILDPDTGMPVQNGLASVSICCASSMRADALSTACFCLGLEAGMALAEREGVTAVFLCDDGSVHTAGPRRAEVEIFQ